MKIETAIRRLMEYYQEAKNNELIRDKVAWSLYKTWLEAEGLLKGRSEHEQKTDDNRT